MCVGGPAGMLQSLKASTHGAALAILKHLNAMACGATQQHLSIYRLPIAY
jgi:hypothetical protein